MGRTPRYVHALRFRRLNRFFDPAVRLFTRERRFKRLLVESARPRSGESILDVGCGSGTLALMVKRASPQAAVHGLDGDRDMLVRATRKVGRTGLAVCLHHADARHLPFRDDSFDRVVSSLFFHHLEREAKTETLREMARVLRPAGRLVIADWGRAADPLQWLLSWPTRWFDGLAVTRDNFAGRLPDMIADSGFRDLVEAEVVRTPVGTLRITCARLPGV
jgi:ubiquinone/menaquinone biosynthesis C-methylase UbiE